MAELFHDSPLPPMRLLRTFECAARLGGFGRAAGELHTTQSAVSRAMAELERRLGTRLFKRLHRGVELTAAGEVYRDAVVAGLGRIGAAGAALNSRTEGHIVIACSHATASMIVATRRKALYRAVGGGDTHVHILVCDVDLLDRLGPHEADVVLTHEAASITPEDRTTVLSEAVTAVCSPAYAEEHADTLSRPVTEWGSLTFLFLERSTGGWLTWKDWFESAGRPRTEPRYMGYYDYVFLIDDAAAGMGLALGWRHYVKRHLKEGTLVEVSDGPVEFDRCLYAILTERGRMRPLARRCLKVFGDTVRRGGNGGAARGTRGRATV